MARTWLQPARHELNVDRICRNEERQGPPGTSRGVTSLPASPRGRPSPTPAAALQVVHVSVPNKMLSILDPRTSHSRPSVTFSSARHGMR